MVSSNFDPSDPQVQLEVMKERLKFSEELMRERLAFSEEMMREKLAFSEEKCLLQRRVTDATNGLRIELGELKRELAHTKDRLAQSEGKKAKKNIRAKFLAFIASFLFLAASILTGVGVNELTATPQDDRWRLMMAVAFGIYAAAAIVTIFLGSGGE